ncbi:MAG: glycerophosphodiester phosphodiesterase family protein [Anaerolineaceae bacterium]|nr:glycerophosphodiester phosphodiesterase family protein [Anaerolineaceae bacterium]
MSTNLAAWLRERPMVYGHRGFSAAAPMNTLAAFEMAADLGADGVELDVQLSGDGHAVVIHDFAVDATTNGSGKVSEMSLSQLKALDAGSWFDAAWRGTQIPTLAEVFEAVGRRLLVNVEIKTLPHQDDGIEQVVADEIGRAGMEGRVLVSSFNPLALQRFRAIVPHVPLARLTFSGMPAELSEMWQSVPCEVLHPGHDEIDKAFMHSARAGGYLVNTWTVNDVARALKLESLGVDGIVSDYPDRMLACLGQ